MINLVELVNVNYLDDEQVDIWPFFMTDLSITPKGISDLFAQVLAILGYSRLRRKTFELSHRNQIALLFFLIPNLRWFNRSDLLGKHAMTTERYGVALQHTAYYLLQLPEHMLSELLEDRQFTLYTPPRILRRIVGIFDTFLLRSPLTTDLCFLVALLCPVMIVLDNGGIPHYLKGVSTTLASYWGISFNNLFFSQQATKKFPFLLDPTSEDYVQASGKVKDTLMDSKIKTHLHKLAEQEELSWLFGRRLPHLSEMLDMWSPTWGLPYQRLLETFVVIDSRISESSDRVDDL